MKNVLLLTFVLLLTVALGTAQTYTSGTGMTGIDILGAHNNGGRGCSGCHAPHSGAEGNGGNSTSVNNAVAFNDAQSGTVALFGQDVTPLLGYSITLGNGYVENLPAESTAYTTQKEELESITFCLACHDGVVARGQMMNGQAWEQRMDLLPSGVYGTRPIPTLLGNDNNNGNNSGYGNDHPVGVRATAAAVRVWTNNATTSPVSITISNGAVTSVLPNSSGYISFVSNYGYPALAGSAWSYGLAIPDGDANPGDAFITCTTCHNQHAMYVYSAPRGKQAGAAIAQGGVYPTYFFVNGPYNPGAGNDNPQMASSTTQFCRQCHFGEANENFGVTNVKTQF